MSQMSQTSQMILEALENNLLNCWQNNLYLKKKNLLPIFFVVTMSMFLRASNTGNLKNRKYMSNMKWSHLGQILNFKKIDLGQP